MRLRDRLARFFWGRYGVDGLYYGLFALYVVIWIAQLFVRDKEVVAAALAILGTLVIAVMVFRVLSRNIPRRRRENEIFMKAFGSVKSFFLLQKNKIRDRKDFIYRKCPACKATLRLPRRTGEHTVRCPRCSHRFDIKV